MGDVAEVERLVEEDGRRLNAQTNAPAYVGFLWIPRGSTPLMVAAIRGEGAAIARLLALGAD